MSERNIAIEDVFETECFLLRAIDNFLRKFGDSGRYDIDVFAVMEISRRYHKDEARIKYFHPRIKGLDGHKKAGYLTYWVSKLKPIVIRDFDVYDVSPRTPHYINEMFAVHLGFGQINYIKRPCGGRIGPGVITKEFVNSLLHTLRYRATTGDNLSMLFYLVDEMVPVKSLAAV